MSDINKQAYQLILYVVKMNELSVRCGVMILVVFLYISFSSLIAIIFMNTSSGEP